MPVPARPAPHLVLVQPDLLLGRLEAALDRPARAGDRPAGSASSASGRPRRSTPGPRGRRGCGGAAPSAATSGPGRVDPHPRPVVPPRPLAPRRDREPRQARFGSALARAATVAAGSPPTRTRWRGPPARRPPPPSSHRRRPPSPVDLVAGDPRRRDPGGERALQHRLGQPGLGGEGVPSGMPAAPHRSRSSVHPSGRYSARSRKAVPCRRA